MVGIHKENGKKIYTSREVQELVHALRRYLIVLETSERDIEQAYELAWEDYEDALQYCTALANGVDCIITNNVKDFIEPKIPVITAKEFLKQYYSDNADIE